MSEGPATDRAAPGAAPSKRSQTVSLVLVAGAAATALGLGHLDPSQSTEDVLVYPSAEACAAEAIRTAPDCREAHGIALAAYPTAAPRYDSTGLCEGHHGGGHCVSGETAGPEARGWFVPRMAGYLIGRDPDQGIVPQPVFEHEPGAVAAHAGHGGYCTGSGARIYGGGGGHASSARVASNAVGHTVFGGFGGTGHSVSAHAASGGG